MKRIAVLAALCFGALPALGQSPKEIWIAQRADGKAGAGTARDPFDGSSEAKLAALMSAAPNNCRIRLGPGTYQVKGAIQQGNCTMAMKDGQQLIGAGMDITILSMIALTPGSNNATNFADCIETPFANNSSIRISDLTCIGNASANNARATSTNKFGIAGITAFGQDIVIERVKVSDTGGNRGEAFPINLAVIGAGNACNFLVTDCVVDNTDMNSVGATAIIFARSSTSRGAPMDGDASSHGEITNCSIYNGGNLGCAGFYNMTVSHCYSDNRGSYQWGCWNSDTGNCSNIVIRDNTFFANGYQPSSEGCINIGGDSKFSNFRVLDNHIFIGANGGLSAGVHAQGNVTDLEIKGNTIEPIPGLRNTKGLRPVITDGAGNARVTLIDNRIDLPADTGSPASH